MIDIFPSVWICSIGRHILSTSRLGIFFFSSNALTLWALRFVGFVVIKQVLSVNEVATAKDLLWRDLELFREVSRTDVKTWDAMKVRETGLTTFLAQTEGAWMVRGMPQIKQAFATIWETDELLVSMDCLLVWRPWSAHPYCCP